ncbi:peptide chain release factor-like protein [Xinfangfangia sp. D13-10-4-6]|uniref:peptide chain release factor-like protein n=1 Tax=Pseudogemmobacter hezensis TaxID=2737662 RepID=UPI0015544846|nr:peptide chain release factor-like protein [Pseudogemmobacter hezensis]NPD15648.1 peptide chain release factor-like protein [Pseudogemmobacter hezensis]
MSMAETLLISSGNGPGECRQAVAHFLAWLEDQVALYGLDLDIAAREGAHGPSSAVVVLGGTGADLLAQQVAGVVLWRCASGLRPKHPRKNWFIQIFRLTPPPAQVAIDPGAVEMQAIRAGGPGGQHQNKTASAIRARWRDDKGRLWSVVVRDSRSQHQNRRIALERLAALIAADQAGAEAAAQGESHALHHQLQRGAPHLVFDGPAFRPAR